MKSWRLPSSIWLSKQVKNHGLKSREFEIKDDAITDIIRYYTREAGVRNLEREIAKVARKSLTKIIKKEEDAISRCNLGQP